MPAPLEWPPERNDQLRRLISAGLTIRATSARMRLARSSVHRQYRRLLRQDPAAPAERKPLPPGDPATWSALSTASWSDACARG